MGEFGNKGWDILTFRSMPSQNGNVKQAGGAFMKTAVIFILLSILSQDLSPGPPGT